MSHLCTTADIRRLSGITADPPTDATLEASQEAIEAWFNRVSGRTYGTDGTAVFGAARIDDPLSIPEQNITVAEVRCYGADTENPVLTLTNSTDWQVIAGHIVEVIYGQAGWHGRDVESALAYDGYMTHVEYNRIEVDWESLETVPANVRDGIALLAGSLYSQGITSTSSIKSEKIGDYSYTLESGGGMTNAAVKELNPIGYALIKPDLRRRRVAVT